MEISETAVVTSKGQLTIPAPIRDIFDLKKGSTVVFKVTERGVFFMPCEIVPQDSYSRDEWKKIEILASEKGAAYCSARGARKHLKSL